jgi:hypothetical protein
VIVKISLAIIEEKHQSILQSNKLSTKKEGQGKLLIHILL